MGSRHAPPPVGLEAVKSVFSAVLGIAASRIDENTSMDSLREWDSLAHLPLMLGLEKSFKVQFANSELRRLTSIRAILSILKSKGN